MKKSEKVLLGFEAKAKRIIHKYTLIPEEQSGTYVYLRLSGFFAHFNHAFSKVTEELSKESFSILSRYVNNDDVDFVMLADRLHQQQIKAKLAFIQNQQPVESYSLFKYSDS